MPIISIPKQLREALGEDASEALVRVLNEQGQENRDSVIDAAEQRFDRKLNWVESRNDQRITEETAKLDSRITTEISAFREAMFRSDLAIKEELLSCINSNREDMHTLHSSTIKWMFIFWIGQIGVLLGILFTVFK